MQGELMPTKTKKKKLNARATARNSKFHSRGEKVFARATLFDFSVKKSLLQFHCK